MASTYSTDLKIELMVTGEKAGQWGDITNTNLNLVQQAIAGFESISIAGGAQTTTLVMTDGALSNARNAVIKLTGAITGNQVVTIPTGIEKTYIVSNGTTGAFTVEFKQASGTGTTFSTVDKGIKILFADGTNIVDVNANLSVSSFEQINLPNQNELRFEDSTGGQYVALKAGATIATNLTLTLPSADGTAGQALTTNGSGVLSFASVNPIVFQAVKTADFNAVAGEGYFVNTTSGAITVTLPSGTPTAGAQIQLVDYAGTFDTNALTINPNSNKIEGATANLQLTGEREGVLLTFTDATQGWLATSGINEGTDALSPPPYSIDFLVVAGGGGGGSYRAGGGGAGGFRTSTQTVSFGNVITVTVGDGGAGGTGSLSGVSGSNSSISGSGLSTITSAGGGFGNGTGSSPATNGGSGGSGGGASSGQPGDSNLGGAGNTPSTSPSQGSNGGNGVYAAPHYGGGGGGGAGAVGSNGSSSSGGNGGNGTASSITGSSVTRAGGGAGGGYGSAPSSTGGTGGGGDSPSNSNGTAGTVNLGGGGGGANSTNDVTINNGGAGGKGVVILAMPLVNFSNTVTGSPTQSDDGTTKRLVFNGDGSYTT